MLRFIVFILISLNFLSCQTKKKTLEAKERHSILSNYCPDNGTCLFEVLNNTTLDIKTDGTGATYPKVNKGEKTVLKFEYKRNEDPRIADDGYKEIIYAEIESNGESLILKDQDLSKAKILFGRLCFCRGQSGYYPVEKGLFEINTNKDKSVTYSFEFEITEVPQVMKTFSVTIN
jgi:hypothetical protein